MIKLILIVSFVLLPALSFSAPICGLQYPGPSETTVVNDYITGENGTDIERITSKGGPSTLCGAPSYNPYWIGSDQVRWYWDSNPDDSCPYDKYYTYYYTSGGSCVSTCTDGVLNGTETAIDCGGSCSPCEPSECHNQILDLDEEGIDCGGSCDSTCELLCPDGWPPEEPDSWFPEGKCFGGLFASNVLGDCPDNTIMNESGGCIGVEDPLLMSSDFSVSEVVALAIPPIDYSFQGDSYEFTEDSTFTTEDNGDGTSTETTVTTVAGGEGTDSSSETTTRIDVVDNSTSSILSSSITTVVNESANESLETFGFDQGIPDNVYDSDITADLPDLLEIDADGGFLDSFISNSSFFTVLNSGQINTSNPVCSLTTPAIFQNDANPSGFTIDFDLCPWESHLQTVGALLLIICQFYALFIVYRGWRA